LKYSHGGNIREVMERYGLSSSEIIDFSANTNPLGISSYAKGIIIRNLNWIPRYPDPECKELRKEISQHLGIDYENIIVGNGSTELIYLLVRSLLPKLALLLIPTFSEYERALLQESCQLKFLELKEEESFEPDIEEIEQAMNEVDVCFLANPNNPTGTLIQRDELLSLVDRASRKHVFIILDEAFIEFRQRESLVKEAASRENLLVLRSFTKFFGLAGLRVGYGVSNEELIDGLNQIKEPWTVNTLAQLAAKEILRDDEYINRTLQLIDKEGKFLFEHLLKIKGLKPYPSQANFILIKIEREISSIKLCEQLAKKGIIIRDCANFRGLNDKFIRVAIRTHRENLKLLEALTGEL